MPARELYLFPLALHSIMAAGVVALQKQLETMHRIVSIGQQRIQVI